MCHKLIIQKRSVTHDRCPSADNLNVWQLIREFWSLSSEYHVGACHTEGLHGVTWMPFDSQPTQTRLDGTTATLSLLKETDCPLIAFKDKLTFIVWHNYSWGALYLLSENSNLTWPESTEHTLKSGKTGGKGNKPSQLCEAQQGLFGVHDHMCFSLKFLYVLLQGKYLKSIFRKRSHTQKCE